MSTLGIIGTIEVAPGSREQVLPLLMAHPARCLKVEPGTLQFDVLVPNDDTTKILIYELYRDAAAFEAHWNGPSTPVYATKPAAWIVKKNLQHEMCALSE